MTAGHEFRFVVITPERKLLEETTHSLVIPAHDGELGILAQHAPLMCELGVGQLRYRRHGRMERIFIDGGFAQVNENQVTVLTASAMTADQITPELLSATQKSLSGPEARTAEARQRIRQQLSAMQRVVAETAYTP
jgi:F-type H+-transporting ATPase subunit epsilon